MLPSRVKHAIPWFKANEELLHAAIHSRNIAFNLVHSDPSASTRLKYVIARRNAQQAMRNAKSTWIKDKYDSISTGFNSGSCGKDAWDSVKILKACLAPTRRPLPNKMHRFDGSIVVTLGEGVEIFAQHFNKLYGRIPTFDPSVIDLLPRQTPFPNLDGLPTNDEITTNISRLHATSLGASGTHARL
jgi:hypothetical protein